MIISFENQLTVCSWYISVWYRSLPPPKKKQNLPHVHHKKVLPVNHSFLSIEKARFPPWLVCEKWRIEDLTLELFKVCVFLCVLHFWTSVEFLCFPEIPRWKSSYLQIVDECLFGRGQPRGHSPMDVVLPEIIWFKDRWIVATLHGLSQEVVSCFLEIC